MDVHRSVNHNSQNMGTRQMYISQWMEKQRMLYQYNEILFTHT
jgi:hypothetical protein